MLISDLLKKFMGDGRQQPSTPASIAKERLQIVVAHERRRRQSVPLDENDKDPAFLEDLQRDILSVVRKYVLVKDEQIQVSFANAEDGSILEVNVSLDEVEETEET